MFATSIQRATHLLGVYLDEATANLRITQAEAHVLMAISSHGSMPIGALHREFGHKPSTLTNVVDRLEQKRLVRRESNPDDRRSILVQLTESGVQAADAVLAALARLENQVREIASPGDLEGVEHVVEAIARAMHQLRSEVG